MSLLQNLLKTYVLVGKLLAQFRFSSVSALDNVSNGCGKHSNATILLKCALGRTQMLRYSVQHLQAHNKNLFDVDNLINDKKFNFRRDVYF